MSQRPEYAAQHTTEHILNAVMQRDFGASRSIEVHFGSKKTKCDYRVPQPIGGEELQRIEQAVNAEIQADHPVETFEVAREEADRRFDMGKVPDSATRIRVVSIGDLDVIPCVGTHVEHTAQIGRFVIRSAEMRDEQTLRIRFALDPRD